VIRGFFDDRSGSPLAGAWVGLVLPERSAGFVPVRFVIDTGAAASAVHPADARRSLQFTGADFEALPRIAREVHALVGITGASTYYVVPAHYILGRDDGTAFVIDGEIRIAQPVPGNQDIPSVLGWDILRHFRILLDQRTGEVLLDEQPPPRGPR
jgi:hypothetical protein